MAPGACWSRVCSSMESQEDGILLRGISSVDGSLRCDGGHYLWRDHETVGLLTPALQALVGTVISAHTYLVEAGTIQRFREAIGDRTRPQIEGRSVAPPTFLRSANPAVPALEGTGELSVVDGGSSWEYHGAILAGDVLTVTTRLDSASERTGRLGEMLITALVTDYTRGGKLVVRQSNTLIWYR